MTNDHNRFIGLCFPYALGTLNPRNRHFFERHIKTGCEICNNELTEIYEAMSLLPLALTEKRAPSSLRNKVVAAARAGKTSKSEPRQERGRSERKTEPRTPLSGPVTMRQSAPKPERPWYGYAVVFLAVVIVVALGMYMNSLIERLSSQEQEILSLTEEMQANKEALGILQAPHFNVVFMSGTSLSRNSSGKIIWDQENKKAVIMAVNLPVSPSDKEYRLWMINDNISTSVGAFTIGTKKEWESYLGVLPLEIEDSVRVGAFAVTLEPKGGQPQPSGEVYLISVSTLTRQ